MHSYPQTNLQLYADLRARGWDDAALGAVAGAYELALEVCGTSVRPNGKPFLCHLVGTAGVVARWGSHDEVVCGLVHAVYTHGSFADSRPGMTEEKRTVVRAAVGDDREALVAAYTELPWTAPAIAGYAAGSDALDGLERASIRVRLANELEDHLDLGVCHARKSKPEASVGNRDGRLVLAEVLVGSGFADELAAAIAENMDAHVPDALVRDAEASFRPGVLPA